MNDFDADNQSGVAYADPNQAVEVEAPRQTPTQPLTAPRHTPTQPLSAPHQALRGHMQMLPVNTKPSSGARTGAILALSMVLLVVLGVGLSLIHI